LLRALLLAAGLGTRLRPITDTVPKCLVEVNGRPLLDYWIELLSKSGVSNILINLHYLSDLVLAYVRNCEYPVSITTIHEDALLGTAGTLLKNRDFFGNASAMLVHADNLSRFDVAAFIDQHERRGKGIEITMMTFRTNEPESCGIVELDDDGIVRAFHEKIKNPPGNLANAAVYIVSPEVINFVAGLNKEVVDFSTEVLPAFLGRINTYYNGVYHRDIGTLESLLAARREFSAVLRDI
jgi:mannose-1-phosphate guanylyltransferase